MLLFICCNWTAEVKGSKLPHLYPTQGPTMLSAAIKACACCERISI
uniref:Uncharacterized protein n=1 Tax=Anguilla anguilla TaxID=7936 RepID=A0A0E9VNL0_ANGAN